MARMGERERRGTPEITRSTSPAAAPSRLQGVRALAVAPTAFFGDYGCHVRIVEEVRALAFHGVQTTVATYPFGRDVPGIDVRRARLVPGQRRAGPGSSLHKFSLDASLAARSLSIASAARPALVHGHLHEGALIGLGVARTQRVPILLDFQGSMTSEMIDHGFLAPHGLARRGFGALERWIVARVDAIVTSTRHGADLLVREFGCRAERITVVPDAVSTDRFRPLWQTASEDGHLARAAQLKTALGVPLDRPVVVYLGLLAEYQGITHLLRAAQLVAEQGVAAHFLIMGFPGEDRYRALAARLGIAASTTFTGAIPYERAAEYLALGDVAVAPKLSDTEGNGKLLNYIAMGLPTVAFDTSVSREILGDLGIYAPCGDWSALAARLIATLQNPRDAEERGKALRCKAVAEHSWRQAVEPLLEVYSRLLGM